MINYKNGRTSNEVAWKPTKWVGRSCMKIVLLMLLLGACTQRNNPKSQEDIKQDFIDRVYYKQAQYYSYRFYEEGGFFLEENECFFTIYEMMDDNTVIYRLDDETDEIRYLKVQIKDDNLWLSDLNITNIEEAKISTLQHIGELKE